MKTSISYDSIHRAFNPRSIAVVGANPAPEKVGYTILNSIVSGNFPGEIYPIHPRYQEIMGLKTYPDLSEIGEPIDLAVLILNQEATVREAEKCGKLGVKALLCVSGGFREVGDEGQRLEKELIAIAERYDMAVIGPNTLGIINTHADLCSIFYAFDFVRGNISFLTQSGGVGYSILMKVIERGLGISKWIGIGNASILDPTDYLLYLAEDPHTAVIGMFLEGVEQARSFVQTAAKVVLKKPVVVYKAGRSGEVGNLTLSHTGSLAGSYRMFKDIFEQFGIITAENINQLLAYCEALAVQNYSPGGNIGIITHTAGPSIVVAEELAGTGCSLPPLSPEAIANIKKIMGENPSVQLKNPLDVAGPGFQAERFGKLAHYMLKEPQIDLLLAIFARHDFWRFPSEELIDAYRKFGKPIVAAYLSTAAEIKKDREVLEPAGIPVFATPEEAAWGAVALVHRGRYLKKKGYLS
ncbi:MAG: acetate--CoA ligase family protein [Dethiobacteria bacterium]